MIAGRNKANAHRTLDYGDRVHDSDCPPSQAGRRNAKRVAHRFQRRLDRESIRLALEDGV